jgi:hypothetical protein
MDAIQDPGIIKVIVPDLFGFHPCADSGEIGHPLLGWLEQRRV